MPRIIHKESYLNYILYPIKLSVYNLILCTIAILLGLIIDVNPLKFPWQMATTFGLFYIMLTSVMHTLSDNLSDSWQKSVGGLIIYMTGSQLLAWFSSGKSFFEAGNYKIIFIIIVISFFIFMLIATLVRRVVEYSEQLDRKKHLKEKLREKYSK